MLSRNIFCELKLQRTIVWKISFDFLEVRQFCMEQHQTFESDEKKGMAKNA
jgi:hypothetical protein